MYGSIVFYGFLNSFILAARVFVVAGLSLVGVSRGYSSWQYVCSFFIAVAPPVLEHRL